MGIHQEIHLRQQQRLVMTPMLQQALKILQLNGLELADLIQTELNENPMLEEPAEEAGSDEAAAESKDSGTEEVDPGDHGVQDDQWEEYFEDNGTDYAGSYEHQEEKEGFESFVTATQGLQETLLHQMDALDLPQDKRAAVEEIIGWIDERGYLSTGLDVLSEETKIEKNALFEALRVVQGMEPVGVGARDLRECLLLQLEARGHKGSTAWKLVSDHLDELGRNRLEGLAKVLKVEQAELDEARREVAALEPIPGRPYGGEPNVAVTVDAVVEKNPKGEWVVHLKNDYVPRLGISRYYKRLMKQAKGADKEETKAYLKDKYQSALWLIKGIEQRKRTLRKVLEAIVVAQEGFLENGPAAFRPLALKDVASVTGMHESTVSRVTTNKYVQTPRGVFELKYFFSGALKTDSGQDASSMAVKEKIKEMVADEDSASPLSDQAISAQLQQQGVRIARRTVAKYREELKILPAHQRRQRPSMAGS